MKCHCIKIFGSKIQNGKNYLKSFKTLKAFEKWVNKEVGSVNAMVFYHGDTIVYKYRYKNGIRRKVGEVLTVYDYKWFGIETV